MICKEVGWLSEDISDAKRQCFAGYLEHNTDIMVVNRGDVVYVRFPIYKPVIKWLRSAVIAA